MSTTAPHGLSCIPASITGAGTTDLSCNSLSVGDFTVTIIGTSGNLSHTAQVLVRVTDPSPPPPPPLTAKFSTAPVSPTIGDTIAFTANATGGTQPYTYNWDFGDASSAAGKSVTHVYIKAGLFTAKLTVADSSSPIQKQSQSETVTVSSPPPPPPPLPLAVDFSIAPTSLAVAQIRIFTASVAGGQAPYSYSWDFGDSSTVSGSTTTYSYSSEGTFNVGLTVMDSSAPDLKHSASHTVTVSRPTHPPSADFSITSDATSLSLFAGSSDTTTIRLDSVNGFSATVTLSVSVTPVGGISPIDISASLTPIEVGVSAGTRATSTLKISTSLLTTIGTYDIVAKGQSGSLSHTTTVSLSIIQQSPPPPPPLRHLHQTSESPPTLRVSPSLHHCQLT